MKIKIGDYIQVKDTGNEYDSYKSYLYYLGEEHGYSKDILDFFNTRELQNGDIGQVEFVGKHLSFTDITVLLIKVGQTYHLIGMEGVEKFEVGTRN